VTVLSKLNDQSLSTNMGIFFCIYQANQIIGNLISSLVFQDGFPKLSSINTSQDVSLCGINYCTEKGTECQDQSYADWKHYLLLGIYTGLGLVSFLIAFFLLADLEIESHGSKITDFALLTGNHIFRSLDQKILVPFCIFTGVQASFIFEAFTAGFVACTFGFELFQE